MTNFAAVERRHLCALLRRFGPDAPTLCEGWTTRDLAVHLILRDTRPDVVAGIMAPKLPLLGPAAAAKVAQLNDRPWDELVALVERPPALSPARFSPVDKRMNTVEFFIHHEDVRRAQEEWTSRELLHEEETALWESTRLMAKVLLRKHPESVVLVSEGFGAVQAGPTRAPRTVLVTGRPGELALWAFGRQEHAEVELSDS